jgi:hypothetical protein
VHIADVSINQQELMKPIRRSMKYLPLAAMLAAVAVVHQSQAQTSEALMDALVKKGILTEQEAEDIKSDLNKENKQYNKVEVAGKTVKKLTLFGDFRGRFEGFYNDNAAFVDRNRFRYRLRAGMTYAFSDNFEAGFRLTSSESVTGGGDPISGNTTFGENAAKKFLFVDLAYGKWFFVNNTDWTGTFVMGKMENPFVFSDMVFDGDYTPEGGAFQIAHNFNAKHAVKWNTGGFVMDELGSDSDDPFFVGTQVRFDSIWSPKVSSSVGVSGLVIAGAESLPNSAVPNVNRGNTRSAGGVLTYNYNPIVADASLTYTLDRFPMYAGAFPIKVGGDYMNNPAAQDRNDAVSVGVTFGKSGKKGLWDLTYRYKYLGGDAWYEEVVDSDFGAFYAAQMPNAGFDSTSNPTGRGYGSGTNVRGHIVKVTYSPFDSVVLGLTWFHTQLIDTAPSGDKGEMDRLQVDASLKF